MVDQTGLNGTFDFSINWTPDSALAPNAQGSESGLTFQEALQANLRIADATAFALCMENELPLIVFGMEERGSILRIVQGEKIGTLVTAA